MEFNFYKNKKSDKVQCDFFLANLKKKQYLCTQNLK